MGDQLTPEEIEEIVKAFQNLGREGLQTTSEAAQERNLLVSNLKRLNGKCFASMQDCWKFELGVIVGQLSLHRHTKVKDQARISMKELVNNTEDNHQASGSNPNV
ncbi:hypothetical protein Pint_19672 [Pistacia integerrima]|uniref:Uncharacterized protein n=1 Tax=Pistacia integerrima TaxID=434235 RepID=A0ACC0XDU7_9ROSI|nr:hypothetical protein Pint_19672 [Pistacia integerrima]